MHTLARPEALAEALATHRSAGQKIGFVPTMGALHAGHLALVETALADCDLVVASIFVNPTQFNETDDFERYPRTTKTDAALLENAGVHYLWLPEVEDIYPRGTDFSLAAGMDYGGLTDRMEGANRPGHFEGVAQVVSRLLEIVRPQRLFLGQKDWQQVAVVRRMIAQLGFGTQVTTVATQREEGGLALSSRNRLLPLPLRPAAQRINRHLLAASIGLCHAHWDPRATEDFLLAQLRADPDLEPEYVEVVHGTTLQPLSAGEDRAAGVILTAVRVGPVRLIDNRLLADATAP